MPRWSLAHAHKAPLLLSLVRLACCAPDGKVAALPWGARDAVPSQNRWKARSSYFTNQSLGVGNWGGQQPLVLRQRQACFQWQDYF
jgi:hypothetical protein